MSKPNRRLIGTSGNGLKGDISLSILSHMSGMNGVLTTNRSRNCVARLGGVCTRATQRAEMFATSTRGTVLATGRTVPRVTVPFAGLALSRARWFDPVQVTWDAVGITGGGTISWNVALRAVTAEDASSSLSGIWLRLVVSKGRTVAGITVLLFVGRIPGILMFKI